MKDAPDDLIRRYEAGPRSLRAAEAMGLTTVGQRPDQQAELGTKMLLDELDGIAGSVRSTVAPHQLIVRSTTAPPPRSAGATRNGAAPGAITSGAAPGG